MILVTGATGHVGRAVVRRLASCGHDVAAMVRDVETARRRLPRGTAMRVGDYEDVLTLRDAFAGIDELVLISSDGKATAVLSHHANAIEAAMSAGIRHITFTSIVDIDGASPFYFAPVYRDAERRLARCGVPATILRCGLYCDFILQHWLEPCRTSGEFALPAGDGRVAPISRDDVATAVAAAATEKSGATYTITGDQALDFGEIAAGYGRAIGEQLRYRSCTQDEYSTSASARWMNPGLMPLPRSVPQSPKIATAGSAAISPASPARGRRVFAISCFVQLKAWDDCRMPGPMVRCRVSASRNRGAERSARPRFQGRGQRPRSFSGRSRARCARRGSSSDSPRDPR